MSSHGIDNNLVEVDRDNHVLDGAVVINPHDILMFPSHKKAFASRVKDEAGRDDLVLYIDGHEVVFDEPELFSFAEALLKQSSFIASTATTWGDGLQWGQIQSLLSTLVGEGIIGFANDDNPEDNHERKRQVTEINSLLPPALSSEPRSWQDCESITQELAGHSVELGYLESIIPVFRIAHITVDSDGRQIGEANVFPSALRIDMKTEWKTCPYAGSRYQEERLMNTTALRVMSQHWAEMMSCIKYIRDIYLARMKITGEHLTVGDVERLTVMVLALPTYLIMRNNGAVPNGELSPVLSSMFRVTDGVRMTAHQMLFLPNESVSSRDPNSRLFSDDVYTYAELNYSFFSPHGVCAGPKVMVEHLLNVIFDGQLEKDAEEVEFSAEVDLALTDIDKAMDYGFRSLQAFAIVHSIWTVMARSHSQLLQFGLSLPQNSSDEMMQFKLRMNNDKAAFDTSLLNTEAKRKDREHIYQDMYHKCSIGVKDEDLFSSRINPATPESYPEACEVLNAAICVKLKALNIPNVELEALPVQTDQLVNSLITYFCYEQAALKAANEVQTHINNVLQRENPKNKLNFKDLCVIFDLIDKDDLPESESMTENDQLAKIVKDIFKVQIDVNTESITACDVL